VIIDKVAQQMFQNSLHAGSSFRIKDIHCHEHLSAVHKTKEISKQVLQGIRDKVKRDKERSSTSGAQVQQLPVGESGPFTLQIWQEAARVRVSISASCFVKDQLTQGRPLKLPLQFQPSLPAGEAPSGNHAKAQLP
jgi:hypothetical protein